MIETVEFMFYASGATAFCLVILFSMARMASTVVDSKRRKQARAVAPRAVGIITLRDGVEREVALDLAALCRIEKDGRASLVEMFATPSISAIRDVILVALRCGGSQLDADGVAGLLDYNRLEEYTKVIGELMHQLAAEKH